MAKKIGVLTSGGDAPGMNAAVRAVCRAGLAKGMEVVGILRGYNGLLNGEVIEMNARTVSGIIQRGGTCLYTARCPEFRDIEGVKKGRDKCLEMGLDGIVVIGGDGSFRGAADLSAQGIPCIGLPGTIDNDISCTEYTIGYDTAMNTAMEMIDKIRDTAQSHDRCSVVEVMGRNAGHIAINVAAAVGAEAVITPEKPYDLNAIAQKMEQTKKSGKTHFIIVVAEGVGKTEYITRTLQDITGVESRATILGHVQRGGSPTVRDRVVATEMGYHAVELLEQGIGNRVVGMKSRGVYETPGGAILYKAHEVLETITLDKETARVKQYLSIKFADIVYNGQWFTPLREAMSAFVTETQKTVTGDVKLKLYKGNMINAGVTSPYTLYDEEVATFDEDNVYNQADSAGFINLFGLPIKVRAKLEQKRNAKKD